MKGFFDMCKLLNFSSDGFRVKKNKTQHEQVILHATCHLLRHGSVSTTGILIGRTADRRLSFGYVAKIVTSRELEVKT